MVTKSVKGKQFRIAIFKNLHKRCVLSETANQRILALVSFKRVRY